MHKLQESRYTFGIRSDLAHFSDTEGLVAVFEDYDTKEYFASEPMTKDVIPDFCEDIVVKSGGVMCLLQCLTVERFNRKYAQGSFVQDRGLFKITALKESKPFTQFGVMKEKLQTKTTLREASEIKLEQLPPEKQAAFQQIRNALGNMVSRVIGVFDGIHGYIVIVESDHGVRIGPEEMKDLMKVPDFRWIEGNDVGASIGF